MEKQWLYGAFSDGLYTFRHAPVQVIEIYALNMMYSSQDFILSQGPVLVFHTCKVFDLKNRGDNEIEDCLQSYVYWRRCEEPAMLNLWSSDGSNVYVWRLGFVGGSKASVAELVSFMWIQTSNNLLGRSWWRWGGNLFTHTQTSNTVLSDYSTQFQAHSTQCQWTRRIEIQGPRNYRRNWNQDAPTIW